MSRRSIVVPLDGTERALVALPVAKHLAEIEAATLQLVHVAEGVSLPGAPLLERLGLSRDDIRGSVLHARAGDPAAGIIDAAAEVEASFIVMCTHTAAIADRTVGRTALGVLKRARGPVFLVRPERGLVPWALRRILLPHDGTPSTSAAIRPAANLARRSGAALDVLHVASSEGRMPTERGAMTPPRYVDQPQHEWPAWVDEFVERLACICPLESLEVHMTLVEGAPGPASLRLSSDRKSDLIVLAWRGEWDAAHAATVKAVIRGAPCPVLVVPTAKG